MKRSTVLWSVLAVLLCVFVIEHARMFAAGPFEFKPNWFAIIPVAGLWVALIGYAVHKELSAAESRVQKAKAELAAGYPAAAELQ